MEKKSIDKLFEDKLKDYTSTPSINLWDRIEKQIPHEQKQEKGFFRRFWWLCLLLFVPVGIGIWYINQDKNTAQKNEIVMEHTPKQSNHDTNEMIDVVSSENQKDKEKAENTEEVKNNLTQKYAQDAENKDFSINQKKNEKNIKTEATSEKEISSTNQKAEEKEVKQNSNEKTEEKAKEEIKETKKVDSVKPQPAKKGVKVIIKLSESEEPKEGKARDFASTKTGKFLRKLKQIKEGETGIPPVQIPLN
ncbi:MAG: hypothetical protein MUC49_00065 [Raineya sp.]|jgi:hypothetical protein|nr:hypothetical protein [Raineya sp.]